MNSDIIDSDDESASTDFAKALADFEGGDQKAATTPEAIEPAVGDRARGRVVAIAGEHALVDIGARSEAVVETSHFRTADEPPRIAVGDTVDLFVIDAGEPIVLAPSMRSDSHAGLAALREAQKAGMPVSGRVTEVNSGGLRVDLGGAKGFCPLSQIELGFCSSPAAYIGRTLEFLVTGIEEGRRSAVLSRRQLLQRHEKEEADRRIATLAIGQELEGTVKHLETFGAFVDLGGFEGLVHVSEIQHARVAHPRDVLVEGQKVKVRILRIETGPKGQRIGLSIKAAAPDPWDGIESRYAPGMRVRGSVARIADFGAFVSLEPGIDGLVHISEIASRRIERVKEALKGGQEVEALVLSVDAAKRRISLSIKKAAEAETDAMDPPAAPKPPASKPAPRDTPQTSSISTASEEPTTMALAFRKAAEKAREKQSKKGLS